MKVIEKNCKDSACLELHENCKKWKNKTKRHYSDRVCMSRIKLKPIC